MDNDVIAYLNAHTPGSDAAKVSTYEVYINQQPFTVKLYDRPDGEPRFRYHAEAYASDLPPERRNVTDDAFTIGNPDSTIDMAISNLHWRKLEAYANRDQ